MTNILSVAEAAAHTMRALTDGKKRPPHVGEVMNCWAYSSYLDGVIEQYQSAMNMTKDKELLDLLNEAYDIARNHKKVLDQFMTNENLPLSDGYHQKPREASAIIPSGVKQSEKEIINVLQINIVAANLICATSASECLRTDLGLMFFRFQADKLILGQKSKILAEKRGWLRVPPIYPTEK